MLNKLISTKTCLVFAILIIVVIISQVILLKPHLQYGFSDVDWGFLSIYKTQNPYSITQLINNFKAGGTRGGVYTHQIYYIGIQNYFFGFNFESFQLTTHIFKILATLAAIPIFLAISGSLLVTFIGTVLFAFSYSTVGTMYTVVTSSDYSAILVMGVFILIYVYAVKKNIKNWLILFSLFLLLILTLFLSTERMYPLPIFIALTEIFLIFLKKKLEKNTVRRILVVLLPPFLIFLTMPAVFLDFVSQHGAEIIQRVSVGNWNLLLTPFIVLGSLVVPHDYIKYLGVVKMDSLLSFVDYLLSGPFIVFAMSTIIIGVIIFKKSFRFILQIFFLMFIFSIILYIFGSHFKDHLISVESIAQALIGFYILAIALASFKHWSGDKDRMLIGLFAAPGFAFLYIFLTWLGASTAEIFSGIHRYLTIPAMFMSLFLANLFSLIVLRILNLPRGYRYIKFLVVVPLLLLVIFININAVEIKTFFTGQLINGFGASEKQLMRSQLLSYLNSMSEDRQSLIYFDFSEDNANGYFYDNTLLGGFGGWMLWFPKVNFNEKLVPVTFWNNPKLLKSSLIEEEGKIGFSFNDKFYELTDFYAFKLKDKKVIDQKSQILKELGINGS